jgi:CRISPR/Cas system CSM-associated protein Csm3 (group 7 of RAMP superfamily)
MTKEYKDIFSDRWSVDFMEDKSENSVPRFLQWSANPRHIERVPAWVEFTWTITLIPVEWIYPITDKELEIVLEEWLKYLNMFWLWGWVSRWNGRIEIK